MTRRLVVKHANRGSVEVIELAALRAQHEGNDGCEDHERGQRHDDEDHAHDARSVGNVVPSQDASTTVNELAGISTAAMSGVITPVTARVAPMRL